MCSERLLRLASAESVRTNCFRMSASYQQSSCLPLYLRPSDDAGDETELRRSEALIPAFHLLHRL